MCGSGGIIYVSDNEFDCLVVQGVIKRLVPHEEVCCFASSEAALVWLQSLTGKQRPRIILLDFFLPDVSGCSLAGQIRQLRGFEKIPFILLAESLSPQVQERLAAIGNGTFVQKSMDLEKMERDLEKMIRDLL